MGFDQFRKQLEYKTQLYGSKLVVVDRFYPSSKTCPDCGEKNLNYH
ncbi:transposase [Anabaena sp. FACHB-1237]|nr:zinc ribbon domain-containing protein [Anabaena sp. FACHB-1237]MBD2137474.1 transposase [Anabaena sp. FACHB-1237]